MAAAVVLAAMVVLPEMCLMQAAGGLPATALAGAVGNCPLLSLSALCGLLQLVHVWLQVVGSAASRKGLVLCSCATTKTQGQMRLMAAETVRILACILWLVSRRGLVTRETCQLAAL